MISYNYRIISVYIIFFFSFLTANLFAQDNLNNIDSSPQNIVPEIIENDRKNIEESNSDVINEVTVSDLPKNNPSWIGNLSIEDGGLGWNMWQGTDSTFAKFLLGELPVNAPSAAMRNLAKNMSPDLTDLDDRSFAELRDILYKKGFDNMEHVKKYVHKK